MGYLFAVVGDEQQDGSGLSDGNNSARHPLPMSSKKPWWKHEELVSSNLKQDRSFITAYA
jgi:hypothetical protein